MWVGSIDWRRRAGGTDLFATFRVNWLGADSEYYGGSYKIHLSIARVKKYKNEEMKTYVQRHALLLVSFHMLSNIFIMHN